MLRLAYIDPGAGSLVLQMVIAGILGALAFFRGAIANVVGFFRGKKEKSKPKQPSEP